MSEALDQDALKRLRSREFGQLVPEFVAAALMLELLARKQGAAARWDTIAAATEAEENQWHCSVCTFRNNALYCEAAEQ